MKISQRLQKIDSMIGKQYQHIWDCCCDHGQLGAALLKRNAANTIHFVDIIPSLMAEISQKLQQFYPNQAQGTPQNRLASWQVHCLDVAKLPLAKEQTPQLVIIAGVGGELTIELVNSILSANPNLPLEFILCPVHHTYLVRQSMRQLGLGLIDEQLLEENKRFYEVLHLSTTSTESLSHTGSIMWDLTQPRHRGYLQNLLKHYQRILTGFEKANKLHQPSDTPSQLEKIADTKTIITQYQRLSATTHARGE